MMKKNDKYIYLLSNGLTEDSISRLLIDYTITEIFFWHWNENKTKWIPESFELTRDKRYEDKIHSIQWIK